jgi:hypothetical protein
MRNGGDVRNHPDPKPASPEASSRDGVWSRIGGPKRALFAVVVATAGMLVWAAFAGGTQPYETYQSTVAADGPSSQYRFDYTTGSTSLADSAGSDTASPQGRHGRTRVAQ